MQPLVSPSAGTAGGLKGGSPDGALGLGFPSVPGEAGGPRGNPQWPRAASCHVSREAAACGPARPVRLSPDPLRGRQDREARPAAT